MATSWKFYIKTTPIACRHRRPRQPNDCTSSRPLDRLVPAPPLGIRSLVTGSMVRAVKTSVQVRTTARLSCFVRPSLRDRRDILGRSGRAIVPACTLPRDSNVYIIAYDKPSGGCYLLPLILHSCRPRVSTGASEMDYSLHGKRALVKRWSLVW